MEFVHLYMRDNILLADKKLMTAVIAQDKHPNHKQHLETLLEYSGAIVHYNMRIISYKDVEWNLRRIIRLTLKLHSYIEKHEKT